MNSIKKYFFFSLFAACGIASAQPKAVQQAILRQSLPISGGDFGGSLSLSADGNTAIVGHRGFSLERGAAHVFVRIGATWTLEASLTVTDSVFSAPSQQVTWLGSTVSLSDDGNTALVCAPGDANYPGVAWVFTRQQGVWQRRARLRPSDPNLSKFAQGGCISGDGSTLVVTSYFYTNTGKGAAWVYTRNSSNQWIEQAQLNASNFAGTQSQMGFSASISQDGNTILLGAPLDNNFSGAAWVFRRTASTWAQDQKLVGTNLSVSAQQGRSVALSSSGTTAIIGAPFNVNPSGGGLIFDRSTAPWSQTVGPLVGVGASGTAQQGESVALSGDGRLAAVGGYFDSLGLGATWLFTRAEDLPGQNPPMGGWQQFGPKLVGTGAVSASPRQGERLALSRDGSTLLVSGSSDFTSGSVWGSVWVFSIARSSNPSESRPEATTSPCPYPSPISRSQPLMLPVLDRSATVTFSVELIDIGGRIVLRQQGVFVPGSTDGLSLSVASLTQGIYMVRFSANGATSTCRVLVTD